MMQQKTTPTTRIGNVQRKFVALRTIRGPFLCLATSQPHRYDYSAILEIGGICYDLKSPEEQYQINELYQMFLSTLSFPIQILWRILPLNLQSYLGQFDEPNTHAPEASHMIDELARDHQAFVHQLAARRVLLDRKIYLIIRADPQPPASSRMLASRTKKQRQEAVLFEQARQELELRVNGIIRSLSSMNISVKRLSAKQQILPLYRSCLITRGQPLHPEIIEGVERPVQLAGRRPVSVHLPATPDGPETATIPAKDDYSDFPHCEDLVAPSAIQVFPDFLLVEDEYVRGISVTHLPRIVTTGWLKPLADLDEPMEISFHIVPKDNAAILAKLRRKHTDFKSSQMLAQRRNSEVDPDIDIAQRDVAPLIEQLASGEGKMQDISIDILIRGKSKQELDERTSRIQAVLHNMLLRTRVPYFEQATLYRSCLPHAQNLRPTEAILLDSHSASSMFPFVSNALVHEDGILEGITPQGDPIFLDPWSSDLANGNRIIFGAPGKGKSHALKTITNRQIVRHAMRAAQGAPTYQLLVVDPDREFGLSAAVTGGQIIYLSPGSPHHVNPFDLPRAQSARGDVLADQIQKLHTLLELMLADRAPDQVGKLTAGEKGLLDRAFYESYRKVGITTDDKTHDRPAPLMRDLYDVLASGICGPDPTGLTQRLHRYVHGSLAGLFNGPTNVTLNAACVVFDVHSLESELRPIGLFLVTNFVWTVAFQSRIPRQLIVDEAASLPQAFLADLVRRARKHFLSVNLIIQQPNAFDNAIISNCATAVLMSDNPELTDLFHLSKREEQLLQRLPIGEALLITTGKRLHIRYETSELEHLIATTNPKEVSHLHANLAQSPLYQRILAIYQRLEATYHQIDDRARPLPAQEQQRQQPASTDIQLPFPPQGKDPLYVHQ